MRLSMSQPIHSHKQTVASEPDAPFSAFWTRDCKRTQWGLTAERDLWTGNGVYAYVCVCVCVCVWLCITALPVAQNVRWHHRWPCSSPVSCPKWEARMWLMEHDASPVCYTDLESVPLRLLRKELLSTGAQLRDILDSQRSFEFGQCGSDEEDISDLYTNRVSYVLWAQKLYWEDLS